MSDLARRPTLLSRLAGIDDGRIIRAAFVALLTGTLAVLYLDFREMMEENAAASVPEVPILPSFDPSGPMAAPGPQVTSDPDLLRAPLTITLTTGGRLELTGTIEPGAAARVAAELDARGEYVRTVVLDSPGGVVSEAMGIGELVRARGYDTLVETGALCASSCPLVFAAGIGRTAAPEAAIGVHQIYAAALSAELPQGARAAGVAMADTQQMTAAVARYLTAMGVDPALWLNALETPPDQLYYLSAEELALYRLTTPTEEAVPLTGAQAHAS